MVILLEPRVELRRAIAEALQSDGHEVVEVGDDTRLLAQLVGLVGLRGADPASVVVVAHPDAGVRDVLQMLRAGRWGTRLVLVGAEPGSDVGGELGAAATFGPVPDLSGLRAVVARATPEAGAAAPAR
jgi:hypothetical protein